MSTNNKNSKTDRKKQSDKAYRWRNCGRRYGGASNLLGLLNSLINISKKKSSVIKVSKKKMALPLLLEDDCCTVKHDTTTLG